MVDSIKTSPITRTILTKEQLSPNRALKDAINKFISENKVPIIKNFKTPIIDMKNKDDKVSINTNSMKIRDKTFISIDINTPNFYDEGIN